MPQQPDIALNPALARIRIEASDDEKCKPSQKPWFWYSGDVCHGTRS